MSVLPSLIGFGFGVGPPEMVIICIVGVLLFGKKLPEVGRSLGKSFIEFKKGLHGIEEEIKSATSDQPMMASRTSSRFHDMDDRDEATAPKFEPPAAEPGSSTATI